MNPFAFLKKQNVDAADTSKKREAAIETDDDEEINFGAKVKIVAAMLVVAVATYVALWVQEPTDLKSDVLSGASDVTETADVDFAADTVETSRVAAADTGEFAALAEVSITDFTFTPANLTVGKGTTVVWTNMDPVDHTVTSDTFSSNALESGDSFDYTFNETGEYSYSCSFHPQMTGKIIVTDEEVADAEEATQDDVLADDAGIEDVSAQTEEDDLPSIAVMEDYRAAADDEDTLTLSEEDLAAMLADAEVAEEEPRIVTLSAEDAAEAEAHSAAAVTESDKLAKSGPEDILYAFIFAAILYFNRRKIQNALR